MKIFIKNLLFCLFIIFKKIFKKFYMFFKNYYYIESVIKINPYVNEYAC